MIIQIIGIIQNGAHNRLTIHTEHGGTIRMTSGGDVDLSRCKTREEVDREVAESLEALLSGNHEGTMTVLALDETGRLVAPSFPIDLTNIENAAQDEEDFCNRIAQIFLTFQRLTELGFSDADIRERVSEEYRR